MNKDIKHTGGYGWQGDFEASMSDDGSWSASVSYVAPPGEKFTPSYSLHCHVPGFTDLTLSGYQHSRMADLWKTSCTFKKDAPQEDEEPDDPEHGDPDTWDFDPKDTKTTWEFTAGVASKSIFDHPDFKSMFQDNPDLKKAYEAIMSGRVDIESLKIDSRLKRKDPYDFGLGGVKYSQELSDLFNKIINKGITDYYTRSCSYSITTTEGKGPDAAPSIIDFCGRRQFCKDGGRQEYLWAEHGNHAILLPDFKRRRNFDYWLMIWTNDLRINTDITPDAGSHQAYGTYRVNRTVSQSEIVPIAGFRRPKWAAASTNPNAPGMVATGYKISLHSPTAYKVTVTYSYPSEGVKEDEEGNPSPDDPEGGGEASEKYKVKISDRSNMTLEPLLSYYKLRNPDGSNKYPEGGYADSGRLFVRRPCHVQQWTVPAEMRKRRNAGTYSIARYAHHAVYHARV